MKKTKLNKLIMAFALVFASGTLFAACGSGGGGTTEPVDEGTDSAEAEAEIGVEAEADVVSENPIVIMTIKDIGDIEIEIDPVAAPITANNFLNLVDEGFYDGLTFHRIILGFMIQGGDPDGTGRGGLSEKIKGEFAKNGWENPISHKRGVISMARSDNPDSASCQFFITNVDALFLDGQYAAFGWVLSGMEVVDEISAVETDSNDRPNTPVVIEKIRRK